MELHVYTLMRSRDHVEYNDVFNHFFSLTSKVLGTMISAARDEERFTVIHVSTRQSSVKMGHRIFKSWFGSEMRICGC
jgi:hypothetical protein